MTIHKLLPEKTEGASPMSVQLSLIQEIYDVSDAIVRTRAIQAFDHAAKAYPIHRVVRCAVRRKVGPVFDDLALQMECAVQRMDVGSLLLDGPGVFIGGEGYSKGEYVSCTFRVWTDSLARLEEVRARLFRVIGDKRLRDQMFVVDWNFCNSRGTLISTSFDEIADDVLLEEAYPSLGKSVGEFVEGYLNARETVLILQGPPGTGKTRLVRAILAAMSRRKGESAKVMYTADKRALENDEIFVDFITGSHDAFVIEDADHLLKARTSGNFELHRFLGIADGVVRAQSRKVIFTTNLPNINDIDDALLRPGRCHAVKNLRSLDPAEALRLAERICAADAEAAARACARLSATAARSYSVAQVYRACA
ncbi:MAG TPA: AAA family ATPase [Steroidobacteraceae bacterium]|nr:AAA family ATPase [Steroidobacteraceae bacterium]